MHENPSQRNGPKLSLEFSHGGLVAHQPTITQEWAWGDATGSGMKVGVIDSGIDVIETLERGVQGYVSFNTTQNGTLNIATQQHVDDFGHGTACASIIRAIAPDCDLFSLKVLDNQLHGKGDILIAALQWALDNDLNICNLSLGTTLKEYSEILHELADRAFFKGMMLVAAAPNKSITSFPSSFASVISVTSHGEPSGTRLRYYYYPHSPIEFGAPGNDIVVPWSGGKWIKATGNSFAAPHITGIIARILSKHPETTPFQMKTILYSLAAIIHITPQSTQPHDILLRLSEKQPFSERDTIPLLNVSDQVTHPLSISNKITRKTKRHFFHR